MSIGKKFVIGIILIISLFLTNFVSAQTISNTYSNISDTSSFYSEKMDESTIIENKQKLNEQVEDQINNNSNRSDENIISEVVEKREEYVKHFKMESGTFMAASYTEPVNYLKDGKWEEIDNTLIAGTDKVLGDVFQNKNNSYKATFSKSTSSNHLVTMQKDQYSITWSLNKQKNTGIIDAQAEVKNANVDDKNLQNNEKIMDASKSRSIITYRSIMPYTDLRYTVAPGKIKEDIIINKASATTSFVFDIFAPGLKARCNEDNSITFYNPDKPEVPIFNIPKPYMIDSSEEKTFSDKISLLLTETKNGYELEITPEEKWINAPERIYPIYLDPTTTDPSTKSSATIVDTYVHPGDAAGNHNLAGTLRVGNTSDGKTRTYIKTNMPSINGTVYDAKLNLSNTGGSSTFNNVDIYRVDTSWGSTTLTWDKTLETTFYQTLIKSNIPVSYYINNPSSYRYSCDITDTVQEFYNGTRDNNGFMVKYTNESINDYNAFYSSDCGIVNVMPVTMVSYAYGETDGITNGTVYYIRNKNSGQYLDAAGAGTSNGTNVLQWPFKDAVANQKWKAIYQGKGLYKFLAMHTTDKYLEVAYNSNSDGTNIDIFNGNYTEQYWSIQSNNNGSFRILSNCSNMSKGVVVEGASSTAGANVFQYTYTGSGSDDNDDWIFEKVWTPTSDLAQLVSACGFLYNPDQDIIYSKMYPIIQRNPYVSGFTWNYDHWTPLGISSILDSQRCYFYDNNDNPNYDYLLELWKGQYGIETGGEIGLYRSTHNDFDIRDLMAGEHGYFDCAPDSELIKMSFTLKKNGVDILYREAQHWWLTGFKWGVFSNPSQLTMTTSITFNNSNLANNFWNQLSQYSTRTKSGNSVSFTFDTWHSEQPWEKVTNFNNVQANNVNLIEDYMTVRAYLGINSSTPNSNDPNLYHISDLKALAPINVCQAIDRIVSYWNLYDNLTGLYNSLFG